ncbi:hypothetical protein NDN08_000502 [Rhodosorus marinus]|uniref:Redoxin domain-containing protein n=1 Tax=Rhodosorus marinus TaxID=101924 RepID=A0AAV8UTR5_9RHOD|nr:hypothetical protein NDN08_000502 [Rhodosorus marinus]
MVLSSMLRISTKLDRAGGRRFLSNMIGVGSLLPLEMKLETFVDGQKTERSVGEIFKGKNVAVCGVPGAFTPTCSDKHVPEYIKCIATYKSKGIETTCFSVNDAFVMKAWKKSLAAPEELIMLSDGNGDFASQLGISMDTGGFGGTRSRRFAMYVEDGIVKILNLEEGGAFTEKSSMLKLLDQINE